MDFYFSGCHGVHEAEWPVVRYSNGTVSLVGHEGEVNLVADGAAAVNVHSDLSVRGVDVLARLTALTPPECDGAHKKLTHGSSGWVCGCESGFSGEDCSVASSDGLSVPPACVAPGGRLSYTDANGWSCTCVGGYSGADCGVNPSRSSAEPLSASPLHDAEIVSASSNFDDADLLLDGNASTAWAVSDTDNMYVVLDLQSSMEVAGVALKINGSSTASPYECTVQYGSTSSGPWMDALDIEVAQVYRWQYFAVPDTDTATRYVRFFIESNRGDGSTTSLQELELYTPDAGTRSADGAPVRCPAPGGRLVSDGGLGDGSEMACECVEGWTGPTCEEDPGDYTIPLSFFPTGFEAGVCVSHAAYMDGGLSVSSYITDYCSCHNGSPNNDADFNGFQYSLVYPMTCPPDPSSGFCGCVCPEGWTIRKKIGPYTGEVFSYTCIKD